VNPKSFVNTGPDTKVKRSTQNEFVYGELGRIDFQCMRYFNIISYWVKAFANK